MSLVRLRNVGKHFDGRRVLREAALRVRRGDRAGLIGPNGAGKTTIPRLILGELEADEGTVETREAQAALQRWSQD
jgi:ATP-binding cassette subfamily F protein uup